MRRDVLFAAAARLIHDITVTGVDSMVKEIMEGVRNNRSTKEKKDGLISFEVFQKYSVAVASYGDAERDIAKILGLDVLFLPETWGRMADMEDPRLVMDLNRTIHYAKQELPKLLALIRQEHVDEVKSGAPLPKELQGKSALTFILPEDDQGYSTPGRLISALRESLKNLPYSSS